MISSCCNATAIACTEKIKDDQDKYIERIFHKCTRCFQECGIEVDEKVGDDEWIDHEQN